jgi:hippurate hydrolase
MGVDFEGICQRAVEIRRDLHRHPELGYEEFRTAKVVREELGRLGISWRACAETGTVAHLEPQAIGGNDGVACIALRADMDALPLQELNDLPHKSCKDGLMHACGHDGHTATLLAVAALLKAREQELHQKVVLLFQPAEEGLAGAKAMIEDAALDGVDEIYGYHNWPSLPMGTAACPVGPVMAANAWFSLELKGAGGHASQPENCRDVVLLASQLIQAFNTVVSRRVSPQDSCVISVTHVEAGGAVNIIPETALVRGSVRAARTELLDELHEILRSTAEGLSRAGGCEAVLTWNRLYPATVNDERCAIHLQGKLREVGQRTLVSEGFPIMGAEDFSFYQREIPGAYALIGTGRSGEKIEVCHSPRFDFNDDILPIAAKVLMSLVGIKV